MIKDNSIYLRHILEGISHIEQFLEEIGHSEVVFSDNLHWQNAFVRELEVIGEAANKLDKEFTDQHSDIPWENIIGMRHKLIHDYFEVKMELVWDTVTIDLPLLKPKLASLVK